IARRLSTVAGSVRDGRVVLLFSRRTRRALCDLRRAVRRGAGFGRLHRQLVWCRCSLQRSRLMVGRELRLSVRFVLLKLAALVMAGRPVGALAATRALRQAWLSLDRGELLLS